MNLVDLVSLGLDCTDASVASIFTIVGWVVWGIKVVVPVILIIIGMIDMARAVTEKTEDKIKDAQQKLIKKAIAAVIVFLVPTLVTLLMSVIGAENWKGCFKCVNSPGKTVDINGTSVECSINVEG